MRKSISVRTYALFLSMLLVVSTSCKKKEQNPDYFGTWSSDQTITIGDNQVQVKDIITLTKAGFDDMMQILDVSSNQYINYVELLGTMTVADNFLNGFINEIGVSAFDGITGKPTGNIIKYKEGTTGFANFFSQNGQSRTYAFEFSVSGTTFTIYSDNNADGDYSDAGEQIDYTKQ